jgi:hypothetical protein
MNQEGNQDPTSNGFVGGLGSASGAAWNIQSSWCCGYDFYSLTGAQVTQLTSANNWALTATFANLWPGTAQNGFGPGSYGSDAVVDFNGTRFDLDLGSDGAGNQALFANVFAGAPNFTIPGLGTNPVTLEVLYTNSTNTANIYVNGTEVIANYAGNVGGPFSNSTGVFFGGQDGTFSQVELQTNASAPTTSVTPEPAEVPAIAVCAGGLVFLLRRKWRSASAQTAL